MNWINTFPKPKLHISHLTKSLFARRNIPSNNHIFSPKTLMSVGSCGMNIFTPRVNLLKGSSDWVMQPENYDYQQELARSAYADMLHDTERNQKYYQGLKAAVLELRLCNRPVHVLDIGTGTGLLSMMAVTCGADSVTACEAFHPMTDIAQRVIADNNMRSHIKLVPKRSTELTVGPGCDMLQKANILVTEVFDTELIGEGAIPTFQHAAQHLLEEDCIVVPSCAHVYAQVVQSDFLKKWNKFLPVVLDTDTTVEFPPAVSSCAGLPAVFDLQLSQLKEAQFKPLTKPMKVFTFDWSNRKRLVATESRWVTARALADGPADAVLMWWDLEMDFKGNCVLSCAPKWAHPDPQHMQWRDHWMQAVYFPVNQLSVRKDQEFSLQVEHDAYSMWFNISDRLAPSDSTASVQMPVCECGAHMAVSRTRLGQLNDQERNLKYWQVLQQVITEDSVCLCISDFSLLPIMAAKAGAKMVFCLERHLSCSQLMQGLVNCNNVASQVQVLHCTPEELTEEHLHHLKPNTILTEPFSRDSVLPWHNLSSWFAYSAVLPLLVDNPTVIPQAASLRAMAVHLRDLWKIRAPVHICEGFDLTHFDATIMAASEVADEPLEPHPLWEYPASSLSDEITLMNFDLSKPLKGLKSIKREGIEELWSTDTCNAVVLWMDYELHNKMTLTEGCQCKPVPDHQVEWYLHSKQAVHLMPQGHTRIKQLKLRYKTVFKPAAGEFHFDFTLVPK